MDDRREAVGGEILRDEEDGDGGETAIGSKL